VCLDRISSRSHAMLGSSRRARGSHGTRLPVAALDPDRARRRIERNHRLSRRLPTGASRAHGEARHPAHLGRGDDWVRPYRRFVRRDALRCRSRSHQFREGRDECIHPARRRDGPRVLPTIKKCGNSSPQVEDPEGRIPHPRHMLTAWSGGEPGSRRWPRGGGSSRPRWRSHRRGG
jgi:hypothetical protein